MRARAGRLATAGELLVYLWLAKRWWLIPVVVVLLTSDHAGARWLAVVVFVVGALSDLVDGYLARRHSMTTSVGAWLDPLSDKLFVIVPAVVLSTMDETRPLGMSVGVAVYAPRQGETAAALILRGDGAMYTVKHRTKNGFAVAPPAGSAA